MGIGYKKSEKTINSAFSDWKQYEYVLLYNMSNLVLEKVENVDKIDWEECLEAYFFSKTKMLHVFEYDGRLKAVEVEDENPEHISLKKYVLHPKFAKLGKYLIVQEYLTYDEDGQVSVALTRLSGIA